MAKITKLAYPKINLMLHITGINSGFHVLESLFFFVESGDLYDLMLFDTSIGFSKKSAEISGVSFHDNSIYMACEILKKSFDIDFFPHVDVFKGIPSGGGLGGGSSDASLFCHFVMNLHNIPMDEQVAFCKETWEIGADVPIFLDHYLTKKNMYWLNGIGRNDEFTPFLCNEKIYILIMIMDVFCSTKLIFSVFSEKNTKFHEKINPNRLGIIDLISCTKNDLQKSAVGLYPKIRTVLDDFEDTFPLVCRISGSGSSCFGVYENEDKCFLALEKLRKKYKNCVFYVS